MTDTRQRFSGSKIRQARHSAGLTQAALARAVNTRERNIVRWENDQHEPRFEHVAAIARATGKPLEFFSADGPAEASDDDEESDPVRHPALVLLGDLMESLGFVRVKPTVVDSEAA